ncbi:sin3 histone deacetylase corepressor complex component SDS3 [Onthophagus taurus]|uniref:sin3 histone deacetylase corepressor complex component SDS3 n=1 Tax=Onthophagus taurus TaxID=166361 RepID=UPI000C20CEED|nr:sin3 histone deacetylase corepressor complex component SDS3 [Onthophagus taurus]
MSLLGSPYLNSYMQDDYDEEDQGYEEEDDRENDEPHDDSDEDTEDASETDTGRHEEPLEIKEQMYQDKLASLKKKLQQLQDGSHHEYNKKFRKLELIYKERLRLNTIYRDYMIECVERDYILEKKAAAKEFEDKKVDLKENLISDFEDKRKAIESERYSMELTGDSMEVKPVMTRKLRRRPNDPVPVPEKRRKPVACQPVFQLDEKEIENDLKLINRGKIMTPIRKPGETSHSTSNNTQNQTAQVTSSGNDVPLVETRVEDGKLWYERKWFHRGQSVYVEGKDIPKFPASISSISVEAISVKKSDSTKVKIISISNLARGKVSIKRRAS